MKCTINSEVQKSIGEMHAQLIMRYKGQLEFGELVGVAVFDIVLRVCRGWQVCCSVLVLVESLTNVGGQLLVPTSPSLSSLLLNSKAVLELKRVCVKEETLSYHNHQYM